MISTLFLSAIVFGLVFAVAFAVGRIENRGARRASPKPPTGLDQLMMGGRGSVPLRWQLVGILIVMVAGILLLIPWS